MEKDGIDIDKVETAEAHFGTITDAGGITHVAKVTFPDNRTILGFGRTPQAAMEDAFREHSGAGDEFKANYSPQAAWSMPKWLTEEEPHDVRPGESPPRPDRRSTRTRRSLG